MTELFIITALCLLLVITTLLGIALLFIHLKIENMEQQFRDALARIGAATDNIAADIRGIKQKLEGAGLPAETEAALLAELEAAAAKLEGIASETPEAEPAPDPAPEG